MLQTEGELQGSSNSKFKLGRLSRQVHVHTFLFYSQLSSLIAGLFWPGQITQDVDLNALCFASIDSGSGPLSSAGARASALSTSYAIPTTHKARRLPIHYYSASSSLLFFFILLIHPPHDCTLPFPRHVYPAASPAHRWQAHRAARPCGAQGVLCE